MESESGIREIASRAAARAVFVPRLLWLATLERAAPEAEGNPVHKLMVADLIRGSQATDQSEVGVDRKQAILVCDLAELADA